MDRLISEGRKLLEGGSIPAALELATNVVKSHPANAEAWALLGDARFRWNDIERSIEAYNEALKAKPTAHAWYCELGHTYEKVGRFSEAVECFRKASLIAPSETVYRASIGLISLKDGRSQEAIEVLEKCVNEAPEDVRFRETLAMAYGQRATANWYGEGEGENESRYALSKADIEEAEFYASKAEALNVTDAEVTSLIKDLRNVINHMSERKFTGNKVALCLAACLAIPGILSGSVLMFIWFGVGAFAYYKASMTPMYKIYKRHMTTGQPRLAAKAVDQLLAWKYGGIVALYIFFLIVVFTPLMAAWNYFNNYIREN